jgi:hypothetical protein
LVFKICCNKQKINLNFKLKVFDDSIKLLTKIFIEKRNETFTFYFFIYYHQCGVFNIVYINCLELLLISFFAKNFYFLHFLAFLNTTEKSFFLHFYRVSQNIVHFFNAMIILFLIFHLFFKYIKLRFF